MKIHMNPMYRKELRVSARSFRFALLITAYNFFLALIALFVFYISFDPSVNTSVDYKSVLYIYLLIAGIECGLVFFIVPILTASSIAGERERQTLEILLTTTMKPMQIVVGKLQSSISMVLLLVVSSVPIISIVFSIGGVPVSAVTGLLVMILAVAIFLGSVGIWCSARLKKTIPAAVSAFAILFIIVAGTIAILWVIYYSREAYYMEHYPTKSIPDMGNSGLILLINPLFTAIDFFGSQLGYGDYLEMVLIEGLHCDINSYILDHWFGYSLISQLAFAVLILISASKYLDPLRKRRMKRKEKKALKELQKEEREREKELESVEKA